ncbi:hypothetical protein E2C01_045689 [Portunus trituberculatus]|uniref:Uncharacterized protein n=1 Tax=Portunus trituberculatus TaxID=210409 RepID=A0A5B7G344_PORTR|nr:hypothetical protein [Portunus trituberculatus]
MTIPTTTASSSLTCPSSLSTSQKSLPSHILRLTDTEAHGNSGSRRDVPAFEHAVEAARMAFSQHICSPFLCYSFALLNN